MEDTRIVTVTDKSNRVREVICFPSHIYKCSCKLFESIGIPCYHIIRMFRGARITEVPLDYITKRWMKNCKRYFFLTNDVLLSNFEVGTGDC
jgi:zinc finger SWIM domain-containing protein 3